VTRRSKAARDIAGALICLLFAVQLSLVCVHAATGTPADDAAVSNAICPIVYPVDENPGEHGYQYIFYGNAFFINKQGYLVTAAHVLSAFRNGGGQPYILVGRRHGPAVLQKADLIAADWEHDVAVLHATPNPFAGDYKVAFLPLRAKSLAVGEAIGAVALRPAKVQDAHTFQAPMHDRFAGQIVDYQFTQEERGAGDTELLLFNHEVLRGQSGAPVLSSETQDVVGIVDGRWLRPSAVQVAATTPATPERKASTLGAAVRIHYAIALLQQHGIAWQASSQAPAANEKPENEENEQDLSVPLPVSVVPAPYPPQSLFGGEVILDALVDSDGKLTDAKVLRADSPFLDKAQSAVQTWSFRPARIEGQAVDERIAVAFEFTEPFLPSPKRRSHTYPEPPDADDRAPVPVYTVEPEYPVNAVAEGSVVVLGVINAQGHLTSTKVIRADGPLVAPTTAAMQQWRFTPGIRAGKNTESAVIVVAAFRRPALTRLGSPRKPATRMSNFLVPKL
jgi:TonB family protein